MSNESRRVVQEFHDVYKSRLKGASVCRLRHRTASFLRVPQLFFLVAAVTAISATGADLKSETVQQWDDYVKAADTRHANRLAHGVFLVSDEVAGQTTNLRNGGVVVTPASRQVPLKVQSGLIHDWTGAAFISKAKIHEVVPVLRNYDRYKDYYRPSVVYAKRIATWKGRINSLWFS
jgi:hypothetical protein